MVTINELTVKAFNKELAEMLVAFAKRHGEGTDAFELFETSTVQGAA